MDIAIGWILIFVAAALRLYEALRLHSFALYGDSVHYDNSGMLILSKHFFSFWGYGPDAYVTPGYPLFLALCYHLASFFSSSHAYAIHFTVAVQAVLAALTVGFMYWTSRRFLRPGWAMIGVLLWVTYPPAIWSITQLLTETLFVLLLWLFIWVFVNAIEQRHSVWWAVSGLTLGLCGLIRPTVFPLLLAGLIVGLLQFRESPTWKPPAGRFLAYVIGFLVPLMPWWIRNYRLLHQIVLSDTEVGNPLLYGSDPNYANDPALGHGLSELQQKQLAIHRVEQGLTHHPIATLKWYTVGKLDNLFSKPWYPPLSVHATAFEQFWVNIHLLWVILGSVGVLIGLWHRGMRFISLLALFFVLVQLPFIPVTRYAFPIMSILFLGVGFLMQTALRRNLGRRRRKVMSI